MQSLILWIVMSSSGRHRAVTAYLGSYSRRYTQKASKFSLTPRLLTNNLREPRIFTQIQNEKLYPFVPTALFSTIDDRITEKGDEIRELKASGIDKEALAPHIKDLLQLKEQKLVELNEKITAKGDEIRKLKENGISKEDLAPHIEELLALKGQLPADDSNQAKKSSSKKKGGNKTKQTNNKKGKKSDEPMSESEIKLNRLAKVEAMREADVEPFEYTFDVTTSTAQLAADYKDKLEPGEEDEGSDVSIAGRIMTRRVFGKLAFFTMQDENGIIQLQFDKKRLGDTFKVRHFVEFVCKLKFLVFKSELFSSLLTVWYCFRESKIGLMEVTLLV